MSLKLVLISPSGTLEKDGKLNEDDIRDLSSLISKLAEEGVSVAIWSNRKWTVNKNKPLEEYLSEKAGTKVYYVGFQAGMPARQRAGSVEPILKKFGVSLENTVLIGAREEDMQAGVNNKLLLLRPAWYGGNLNYGFEFRSIDELGRFCILFGTRTHPFYWRVVDQARKFEVSALGPFSTMIHAFAKFGEDAKNAAKYETGTLQFWHQLIISTLYFSGLIHKVDLIAAYPGHSAAQKDKAFFEVLDLLGKCFNKPFLVDLFIRHEDAVKSTSQKAANRKFASQINTLRLNKFPSKYGGAPRKTPVQLSNKNVLVVDDICTSGRSLDTARVYLSAAGANATLFCWLKTVNTDFFSIEPNLALKPFEKNGINDEPSAVRYFYAPNIVDAAAVEELNTLLQGFQQWKVKD
ncbi:phosphoribosyltransferase [Pseudacidovorax intermedius]|uniref:phosphoribosyltransferase n=1 Tax=Pseudacidovorax intermedius TaxID=433924 RepID=UPI0026F190D2|nr:phosphoribosyltransferase [Pseudacidovorax intermedius]